MDADGIHRRRQGNHRSIVELTARLSLIFPASGPRSKDGLESLDTENVPVPAHTTGEPPSDSTSQTGVPLPLLGQPEGPLPSALAAATGSRSAAADSELVSGTGTGSLSGPPNHAGAPVTPESRASLNDPSRPQKSIIKRLSGPPQKRVLFYR